MSVVQHPPLTNLRAGALNRLNLMQQQVLIERGGVDEKLRPTIRGAGLRLPKVAPTGNAAGVDNRLLSGYVMPGIVRVCGSPGPYFERRPSEG